MAIEIVEFPIKNGGSFHSYVAVYQRVSWTFKSAGGVLSQMHDEISAQLPLLDSKFRKISHNTWWILYPIGSMYGIYANIGGILMVNVTIYAIHGSYGYW